MDKSPVIKACGRCMTSLARQNYVQVLILASQDLIRRAQGCFSTMRT